LLVDIVKISSLWKNYCSFCKPGDFCSFSPQYSGKTKVSQKKKNTRGEITVDMQGLVLNWKIHFEFDEQGCFKFSTIQNVLFLLHIKD